MLRAFLCGLLSLSFVVATTARAEEADKDAKGTRGTFVSWKDGTLVVKSGKKGEEKDTEVRLPETVKVYTWAGADRKEVPYKEAFRDVKPNTPVFIMKDGDKITGVIIGEQGKKNP